MIKINLITNEKLFSVNAADEFNKNIFADNYINENFDCTIEEIQKEYVPKIRCDVFISYCHDDEEYAKALASHLNDRGYTTFIDCLFWKSIDSALKKYDNKYCKNSAGNYDYDMRNKSTASFHMILTDSIIETVRNSKIFIMINTLNYMKEGRTVSPWIYLENKIANEQKNPIKINDSFTESITYPVKTNGFIETRTYADILNILKEYKW